MDGVRSVRLRLVPSPVCVLQAVWRFSRHTHSHRATGDHSTGQVTSTRLYHWPASIFSYKTYTWHESWDVLKRMLTFSLYNRCCRSPWASVIRSSLNPPLTPGKKTALFIWSAHWLRFFSRWFLHYSLGCNAKDLKIKLSSVGPVVKFWPCQHFLWILPKNMK